MPRKRIFKEEGSSDAVRTSEAEAEAETEGQAEAAILITKESEDAPQEGGDAQVADEGEAVDNEVPDEAATDEVRESQDGAFGEPEPEPDTEPVGGPEPVVEEPEPEPAIQIPNPGALVLVTDAYGVEHEAFIIRELGKLDRPLVVCTKDGSDDQIVVLFGEGDMTWRAPS